VGVLDALFGTLVAMVGGTAEVAGREDEPPAGVLVVEVWMVMKPESVVSGSVMTISVNDVPGWFHR
jgi:hypothetical protein